MRFEGWPGAAGRRAHLRVGAARPPPPLLPCAAADVRELVAQGLLAER